MPCGPLVFWMPGRAAMNDLTTSICPSIAAEKMVGWAPADSSTAAIFFVADVRGGAERRLPVAVAPVPDSTGQGRAGAHQLLHAGDVAVRGAHHLQRNRRILSRERLRRGRALRRLFSAGGRDGRDERGDNLQEPSTGHSVHGNPPWQVICGRTPGPGKPVAPRSDVRREASATQFLAAACETAAAMASAVRACASSVKAGSSKVCAQACFMSPARMR